MPTLALPDCRNARDLAGTPLPGGRAVEPGALLRSDNHDRLTPEGVAAVRALGVARIVDLRHRWEAEAFPSPFRGDPVYRNVPMEGEDTDLAAVDDGRVLLDRFPAETAAAFGAVAKAPPGPVLVHCHAGRDRTGTLIALLLAVAGADAAAIADDYALTPGAERGAMIGLLDHLDRRYGGARAYLAGAGVSAAQLDAAVLRLGG
ncbi:tyrosine-protein phosphatase [Glycomyces paridis]|uniref:Tyrosine-protein phosphatase n=1 Tax=Glycomyces paridis TaxID=2126555 RepID=A0A4S8PBM8_9ACTN|nr:tyrosine-protein phosphatase [Glycomyces paridis]THV26542.1 tyrosine-protein phosphatase [Glycomyces paridis]